MMSSALYSAVRTFEGCLKRMRSNKYYYTFHTELQISELPSCLLELPDDVKSTLECSEDFRRVSEKNRSQIHYYTFQTELSHF